ncbi:MAG: glycerol-3-phosphate 1-O-acyltransferase PlsY [Erysipelotrichaceae bacterium]|nr:glycerol-3-phosphate 1-O-acyltransferase PlsY [Erysipelotrichaceae bacterium]
MKSVILYIFMAYLIGSVPWGLIIGKVFFDTDIRDYGSGNLGGTNAGRVLGFPIGLAVIFLDGSKALLAMYIVNKIMPGIEQYVGLAACLGHCFPVFAGFRGGKAVSCTYGYLLGLGLFVTHNIVLTFLVPVLSFFMILYLSRMVSLSSMLSVLIGALVITFFVDRNIGLLVLFLAMFIIYRHRANIKRIIEGKESKVFVKK